MISIIILLLFLLGAFDASVVDIYKGAHAVIFLISPFDIESLNYVQSIYKDIPLHINILLILNFRDKVQRFEDDPSIDNGNTLNKKKKKKTKTKKKRNSFIANERKGNYDSDDDDDDENEDDDDDDNVNVSSQAVTFELHVLELLSDIREWRNEMDTENKDGYKDLGESVHAIEISNLNCYGLKELHQYIMLPYLRFKRMAILDQAEQMRKAINKLGDEIYKQSTCDTNNYAPFMKKYIARLKANGLDKSIISNTNDNKAKDNAADSKQKEEDDDNDDDDDDDDDEEEMIRERERAKAKVKEDARKARKASKVKEESLPDDRSSNNANNLKIEHKNIAKKTSIVEEDDNINYDNSNPDDIYAYRPNVGNKALTDFLDSSDEEEKPAKVITKSKAKKSNFDEPTLPAPSNSTGLKKSGLQRVGRKSKTSNNSSKVDDEVQEDKSNYNTSAFITSPVVDITSPTVAIEVSKPSTEELIGTTLAYSKVSNANDSSDVDEKIDKPSASSKKKKGETLAQFLDSDDDNEEHVVPIAKLKSKTKNITHDKNEISPSADDELVEKQKIDKKEEEIVKVPGALRRPRKNKLADTSKVNDLSIQLTSISDAVATTPSIVITTPAPVLVPAPAPAPAPAPPSIAPTIDIDDDIKTQSILRRPRKVESKETLIEDTSLQSTVAPISNVAEVSEHVTVYNDVEIKSKEDISIDIPKILSTESEVYRYIGDKADTIESKSITTESNNTTEEINERKGEVIIESIIESSIDVATGQNTNKLINTVENIDASVGDSNDNYISVRPNTVSDDKNLIPTFDSSFTESTYSANESVTDYEEPVSFKVEVESSTGTTDDKVDIVSDHVETYNLNPLSNLGDNNHVDVINDETKLEAFIADGSSDILVDNNRIDVNNDGTESEAFAADSILDVSSSSDVYKTVTEVDNKILDAAVSDGNELEAFVADGDDEEYDDASSSNSYKPKINELEAFIADDGDDEDYGKQSVEVDIIPTASTKSIVSHSDNLQNISMTTNNDIIDKSKKPVSRFSRNVFKDDYDDDDDDANKKSSSIIIDDDEIDDKINFDKIKITITKDSKNAASLNSAISQIMSSFQQQIETGDNLNSSINVDDDDDGKKKKKKKEKKVKKEKKAKKEKKKKTNDDDDDDDEDDDDL